MGLFDVFRRKKREGDRPEVEEVERPSAAPLEAPEAPEPVAPTEPAAPVEPAAPIEPEPEPTAPVEPEPEPTAPVEPTTPPSPEPAPDLGLSDEATDQLSRAVDAAEALDADEPEEVRAERAKVEGMLAAVGPELRSRRIIELLGVTFGRLAPQGDWGATTLEFRPGARDIYVRVGVDGPEGHRAGSGGWNPVTGFVEILLQELQRSMYAPGTGTWIDGRLTFTYRGPRTDERGRPLAPEADVRMNYSEPPTVGVEDHPWTTEDAKAFLERFPRSEAHVPAFVTDLTQQRRRPFGR